ncbi:unnamed protein product, partial [Closterium sp. Naga37s-1]
MLLARSTWLNAPQSRTSPTYPLTPPHTSSHPPTPPHPSSPLLSRPHQAVSEAGRPNEPSANPSAQPHPRNGGVVFERLLTPHHPSAPFLTPLHPSSPVRIRLSVKLDDRMSQAPTLLLNLTLGMAGLFASAMLLCYIPTSCFVYLHTTRANLLLQVVESNFFTLVVLAAASARATAITDSYGLNCSGPLLLMPPHLPMPQLAMATLGTAPWSPGRRNLSSCLMGRASDLLALLTALSFGSACWCTCLPLFPSDYPLFLPIPVPPSPLPPHGTTACACSERAAVGDIDDVDVDWVAIGDIEAAAIGDIEAAAVGDISAAEGEDSERAAVGDIDIAAGVDVVMLAIADSEIAAVSDVEAAAAGDIERGAGAVVERVAVGEIEIAAEVGNIERVLAGDIERITVGDTVRTADGDKESAAEADSHTSVALLITSSPVALLITSPPVALLITSPPVALLITSPPVALLITSPPVALLITSPPVFPTEDNSRTSRPSRHSGPLIPRCVVGAAREGHAAALSVQRHTRSDGSHSIRVCHHPIGSHRLPTPALVPPEPDLRPVLPCLLVSVFTGVEDRSFGQFGSGAIRGYGKPQPPLAHSSVLRRGRASNR